MPKIQVIVYENGVEADQSQYSEQELESLLEQIEGAWKKYDVTVNICDECEQLYVTSSDVIPESLLNRQIPITPRKFGVREWPEDMSMMFTLKPLCDEEKGGVEPYSGDCL